MLSNSPSTSHLQEIIIHDHDLPPGWKCRYDPVTCKYTFIHEHQLTPAHHQHHPHHHTSTEQHTSGRWGPQHSHLSTPFSSPSRTVSPAACRYSSQQLTAFRARSNQRLLSGSGDQGGASASRIGGQFPSVPLEHIESLLRLYNRRENLVISALLSEGHPRSSFLLDEALFYKLKAKFPQVESEFIRQRLIRNCNREHETIADILGSYALFNAARYDYPERPVLKLKWLRLRYPTIDELVLYDLLLNNDLDVRKVVERLTEQKYVQEPVPELTDEALLASRSKTTDGGAVAQTKISETAVVREALAKLNAPRPTSLSLDVRGAATAAAGLLYRHHNLEEQEIIRRQLKPLFPDTDVTLLNAALEATNFELERATEFLQAMTPQTAEKYFLRSSRLLGERLGPAKGRGPPMVSREVQTGKDRFQDLFGRPLVVMEATEDDDDDDRDEAQEKTREDKSTWTKEDGVIQRETVKLAKGPMKAIGRMAREEYKRTVPPAGPTKAKGPDASLPKGPQRSRTGKEDEVGSSSNKTKSIGPQKEHCKGPVGRQVLRVKDQNRIDNGEEFLKQVHHALLELEVTTGDLVCPETGRKFPIKNGIPNMLCNEDEI